MPRRRGRASEEGTRVKEYKEAEKNAKFSLQCARDAASKGLDDEALEHLDDAREDGEEAERLRIESAEYHEYHGSAWSDGGHDRAVDWIQENIFQKADDLESELKMKAWQDLEKSCQEVLQASQQIKQACGRMKEASQQDLGLGAIITDMEQANIRLEQASGRVDELRKKLEIWCDTDEEDYDDEDDEDDEVEEVDDYEEYDGNEHHECHHYHNYYY